MTFIDEGARNNSYAKCLRTAIVIKFAQLFQCNGYWNIKSKESIKQALFHELKQYKDISEDDLFTLSTKVKTADLKELEK